jgi:hypothetical protein
MTSTAGILHRDAAAHHLAMLRVFVFGLWMADVAKDPITEMAGVPFSYFRPVGVLQFLPTGFWSALASEQALQVWWIVLLVFLALSALGATPYRVIAGTTCVLLTLYQGMIFGFSEVTHAELVALYAAYILAIFPSADALSIHRPHLRGSSKPLYEAALLAVTVVLLATYMLTGVRRVFAGGVDIFTNGTVLAMVADGSATPDHFEGSPGLWALESEAAKLLLQAGFVVVTLFEILSLLCLSSKWFRRCWVTVMLSFHVLSWPLFQTLFLFNMLLIGALLIDLRGIAGRLSASRFRGSPEGRWVFGRT